MSLAGIQPLAPGFTRCEIRTQLADLELVELTVHTVQGPIRFNSRGKIGSLEWALELALGCEEESVVSSKETFDDILCHVISTK